MSEGAGKGSKWRKDFNFQQYYTNMSIITGELPAPKVKTVIKKNGKVTYVYK